MFTNTSLDYPSNSSSPTTIQKQNSFIKSDREKENKLGALYNHSTQSKTHTIPMNTLGASLSKQDSNTTKWEDLRRQARHIEQDLDVKLVSFSKLGSSGGAGGDRSGLISGLTDGRHRSHHSTLDFDGENPENQSSNNPSAAAAANDDMFKTMAMEINSLLENLSKINQNLTEYNDKHTQNSNAAMNHTLQRHRDILQDFQQEFNKIKSNIEAQRQREDLLGSVRRDIDMHYRQKQQMSSRSGLGEATGSTQSFMNERAKLLNSERLTQEAIEMGKMTRKSLADQRGQFAGLRGWFF